MSSYSMDLRQRVVDAYHQRQGTEQQIAVLFGISTRTLQRYLKRHREEGTLQPRPPNAGRKAAFEGSLLKELDRFVQGHPDATLEAIRDHFADRVRCSIVAVHNALKRLDWRYKKSRYVRASRTDPT